MTADPFDWDEELPPETEAEVYRALLRALQRKQGFGLFFVQCTPAQGTKILADLRRDLHQQQIQALHLQGEVTTLSDQIVALWRQHPFDVLVIDGLEASLYAYEDVKRLSGWSSEEVYNYSWKGVPKLLNHLNQQREHLRNEFPARLVFLVPPFVVDYFIQRAPDFLDWRSGLFRFPRDLEEIVEDADQLVGGSYNEYLTLPHDERTKRILTLKDCLQDCSNSDVDLKVNLLLELGRLYRAGYAYKDAIISYDKAIELKPDYHKAWFNRGLALSALGRKEAIDSYDKAIEFKPDYYQAWNGRGNALSALGRRKQEAIDSYDKAIELKPDYHEAWFNRGLALSALGRKQEAIDSYDKAIELKPDKHEAWYSRGNALYDLGRKQEAIDSYDKAIELKPDYHEAWNNRGYALYDLGRKQEAIDSCDKAIEFKPDVHQAWFNRGLALSALGRKQEAIDSYDKAIEFKPDKHEAWCNRGVALMHLKQFEQAHKSFDQVILLKPDDADAHYNKACCYSLQGQVDPAIENLQHAITLDPKYREKAKTDSDFDPIRQDDRFQRLIGE